MNVNQYGVIKDLPFATHSKTGLSESEVKLRFAQFGVNESLLERPKLLPQFFKKFWEPSSWMLELIIVISFFLGKLSDLSVVCILLIINASLSFLLERRASLIVELLRTRLQITVRVLRTSNWKELPARELVPDDIIRIRAGDFIPADLRLIKGCVDIDQSEQTGESIDIHCQPGDDLMSGSTVRRGEAEAVVLRTGANSKYANTAHLIEQASPKLHIQEVVMKVVTWLFFIVLAMMVLVLVLALVRSTPLINTIPILLVLLMGAIPISLPVMFTVCLSVGSKDLSNHGVLVTRLSAVEDAATMTQLCIDKTGTITLNQLEIICVVPFEEFKEEDVILVGALACQESNQDPIDKAFIRKLKSSSLNHYKDFDIISFTPFDAVSRCTRSEVKFKNETKFVIKGAVSSVIKVCVLSPVQLETISLSASLLGERGYRVLGVAQGANEETLEFAGLVALYDPPRTDAKQFIKQIRELGVSLKMLTGDALVVAQELSTKVGLGEILSFKDFETSLLAKNHLQLDMKYGGFAEVFPESKYQVVKSLQSMGCVTGMTGDGVNDAPALRQAEVGIAVGGASDIARGAASIVLTQPGLINIVYLILCGRRVYQRLLTWIINKISRTILKIPYVAIAFLITDKFVISAFAMLLLVLITDATKIALATDEVRPSKHPESWSIDGYIFLAATLGLLMLLQSLCILWFGWNHWGLNINDEALNTFSFLCLLYIAAFSILSVRERLFFWSTRPGYLLLISFAFEVFTGTLLTTFGLNGMQTLPWNVTIQIFLYSMVCCLFINDLIKYWIIKRFDLSKSQSIIANTA